MEGTTGGVLGQPWEDPRRRWRGGRGSSLGICPGERQRAPLPIRRHCASVPHTTVAENRPSAGEVDTHLLVLSLLRRDFNLPSHCEGKDRRRFATG